MGEVGQLKNFLVHKPKKYLIFDFDETLFRLNLRWEKYTKEMKKRLYQLDPDPPKVLGITNLENAMTQKWGMKAALIRWEYSRQFETEALKGVTELEDMTDFVRKYHDKYTYYLWTSNMRETVEPILQRSGLLPYFKQLVTKGDVLLMKPFPEGFNLLFDKQTQKRSEFLMIGDSKHDKEAAAAAGIESWLRL